MASVCGKWNWSSGTSSYIENKDRHYVTAYTGGPKHGYVLAECHHQPSPPSRYRADRGFYTQTRLLPPPVQISTQLTSKNSTQHARRVQAELFAENGYGGPIQAGEVKALKNLLKALGKSDHVVYGWMLKENKDIWGRTFYRMKGPNYLFKSPIKGLDFKDFIMLSRMYKDGKGLKQAVQELLKRVPAELKSEAETFRTVDVLAGLGEKA